MRNEDPRPMFYGANAITFETARLLRKHMTETEHLVWNELSNKKLGVKFRRQHPAGPYILDFYCHKHRLAIEIDGGYHLSNEQRIKDRRRDEDLQSFGVKVIRITNEQIQAHSETLRTLIMEKVEESLKLNTSQHTKGSAI